MPPTQPSEARPAEADAVTALSLAAMLLRHLRLLILGGLAGAVLAAAWSLLVTERYTATTVFAPGDQPTPSLPSGLAALGSQLGAAFSAGEGTRSLQFYADLITSHDLLARVARDTFSTDSQPALHGTLVDILNVDGDTPARRLENTIVRLQDQALEVTVNDRTSMITLDVTLPSARLAADVANRIYGQLESFNMTIRQSSAASRRQFAERELKTARNRLESAEGALSDFLERNRSGLSIPRLALERERLQRRIDVAQIAFAQLTQELVEARMAEARDVPVFTVVRRAAAPLDRTFPHRTRISLLGGVLGACAAALLVAMRATAGTARTLDPEGAAALSAALPWRRGRSPMP